MFPKIEESGVRPAPDDAPADAAEGAPDVTDFMALQELLAPEERAVRAVARRFVEAEVLPIIERHAEEATFPTELVPRMGALGFFGAMLPARYGGAGLSAVAHGLLMYELERGDSALRSFAAVQGSLVMWPIFAYGTEAQRERWLPRLARGELVGCFGLTEPDFGSNPAGLRTRAVREGSGRWRIDGAKMWITNGSIADVALVWARTDDGIRGFLVERGTPGFTAEEVEGKLSLRASITSELQLEGVVVDEEESLLPGAVGLRAPLSCLSRSRSAIAWGALGAAEACYRSALDYALQRVQFDRPVAAFQLQQEKLALMLTELTKGQLLALRLGRLQDEGKCTPAQISMAKMANVAAAREICSMSRTILGANGILGAYPVMRHMANLEAVYTHEGTHDMHLLVLGEAITGIPAFRG